ncbi:hypothetical protein [Clostridium saccharoperbutylacetonicum]|nr:hypothetical protein [Clostridium saccharoperbutylacetonicum]
MSMDIIDILELIILLIPCEEEIYYKLFVILDGFGRVSEIVRKIK